MDKKYFITVDWCNNRKRGIFCSRTGAAFPKEKQHTEEEMHEILGHFSLILGPKSEQFTEKEVKQFTQWRPLAEYQNQYGIALKKEGEN